MGVSVIVPKYNLRCDQLSDVARLQDRISEIRATNPPTQEEQEFFRLVRVLGYEGGGCTGGGLLDSLAGASKSDDERDVAGVVHDLWRNSKIGGTTADVKRALSAAHTLQWPVVMVDEIDGSDTCRGQTDHRKRMIQLRRDPEHCGQLAYVTYHELGHAVGDHCSVGFILDHCKCRAEMEAELTAFLVSNEVGLDRAQVELTASTYLAGWAHLAQWDEAVENAGQAVPRILEAVGGP